MTQEEIIKVLEKNLGKQVWVTFDQEEPIILRIVNLDSEGFSNHVGDEPFWAIYEDVVHVKEM